MVAPDTNGWVGDQACCQTMLDHAPFTDRKHCFSDGNRPVFRQATTLNVWLKEMLNSIKKFQT